jgi:salicylate hydroxylase
MTRVQYLDGPVAIIGAGIGGLTAALSLQHFGVPVRVVEQARALSELERGPDPDSFVPEFGAAYCNLHRADLHLALTDAVAKGDPDAILLDHHFDYLEQDGGKVIAHFSNGTTFEAPALIGADGGASAVRDAVFGGQDASYTGHVALRALVPITRVPQAIIADPYALYVGAGRSLIHYPLRRQSMMNLLGNAQAPQWQAEGWSIGDGERAAQAGLTDSETVPDPTHSPSIQCLAISLMCGPFGDM